MTKNHLYTLSSVCCLGLVGQATGADQTRTGDFSGAEFVFFVIGMGLLIIGLRNLRNLRGHRFVPPRIQRPLQNREPDTT